MGTVTKSIGTNARNYSTLQAWEDALPANLVTDGNSQVGECYNDSEFSAGLLISGETTDSTHTITLQCHAGQSFRDNANAQTNRLAYIQANGVGLKFTGTYATAISVQVPNVVIDGLQIDCTGSPSTGIDVLGGSTTNVTFQNLIVYSKPGAGSFVANLNAGTDACSLLNSLIVNIGTTGGGIKLAVASKAVNVTNVRPSNITAAGTAYTSVYGTAVVRNNAFFGYTTDHSGTFAADGHNCTELAASPGSTSNLTSKTYANQFVQSSTGSNVEDFQIVGNTADLYNAGVTDTTDITAGDDIVKTSRPQGASWDIGAWELTVSSGSTGTLAFTNSNDTSAASGTTTILATLTKTNANDTSAGSSTTTVLGTLSKTNANDTLSASGKTTVIGTVSVTLANDTLSAAGYSIILASLAKTNLNDTLSAAGNNGAALSGLTRILLEGLSKLNKMSDDNGLTTDD